MYLRIFIYLLFMSLRHRNYFSSLERRVFHCLFLFRSNQTTCLILKHFNIVDVLERFSYQNSEGVNTITTDAFNDEFQHDGILFVFLGKS